MEESFLETNNKLIESSERIRLGMDNNPEYPFITRELRKWEESDENVPIKFQEGTVIDEGKNGYQVEEVLFICLKRISELNVKFPCSENISAMSRINDAIKDLVNRKSRLKKKI